MNQCSIVILNLQFFFIYIYLLSLVIFRFFSLFISGYHFSQTIKHFFFYHVIVSFVVVFFSFFFLFGELCPCAECLFFLFLFYFVLSVCLSSSLTPIINYLFLFFFFWLPENFFLLPKLPFMTRIFLSFTVFFVCLFIFHLWCDSCWPIVLFFFLNFIELIIHRC